MQNSNKEIFINKYCSVEKSDSQLTILMDRSKLSLFYQFLIVSIIFFAIAFLFILLVIYNIIVGLSFLFLSFFPCLFLYHKFQKRTWSFDKTLQTITFKKVFTYLRQIRTINFSEIDSLIYRRDIHDFGDMHKLFLILNNAKNIKIFKGFKDECKQLGDIISEFIDKKFYGP